MNGAKDGSWHSPVQSAFRAGRNDKRQQDDEECCRRERKTIRHDGRPAVAGMNEAVEEGECENDEKAEYFRQSRPEKAGRGAQEVDSAGDDRDHTANQPGKKQPRREILPHEIGRLPEQDVGRESQREADEGDGNEQSLERVAYSLRALHGYPLLNRNLSSLTNDKPICSKGMR